MRSRSVAAMSCSTAPSINEIRTNETSESMVNNVFGKSVVSDAYVLVRSFVCASNGFLTVDGLASSISVYLWLKTRSLAGWSWSRYFVSTPF